MFAKNESRKGLKDEVKYDFNLTQSALVLFSADNGQIRRKKYLFHFVFANVNSYIFKDLFQNYLKQSDSYNVQGKPESSGLGSQILDTRYFF